MRITFAQTSLALLLLLATPDAAALDWEGRIQQQIKNLQSNITRVRLQALDALGKLPPARCEPHILKAMEDPSPTVRQKAAMLAVDNKLRRALPIWQRWLSDWDLKTRVLGAESLGKLGQDSAVSPLIRVLGDPEYKVRLAVVRALGRLKSPRSLEIVPLLGRLRDTNSTVRRAVVEVLAQKDDRRAVIPLMGALQDSSSDVRKAAADALGRLGDPGARTSVERLLADRSSSVVLAAIQALGRLGQKESAAPLISVLNTGSNQLRHEAATALGTLGSPRALQALIAGLGKRLQKDAARRALVNVGPGAAPHLKALLSDPRTPRDLAIQVVHIAGEARIKAMTPELLAQLRLGRLPRLMLVQALGRIGDARAQRPLLSLLEAPDTALRLATLQAIKPLVDQRAASPLLPLVLHSDRRIRLRTVRLLRKLGARESTPALSKLALGADKELAREALGALAHARDPRCAPTLIKLLQSKDRHLRRQAGQALSHIARPSFISPVLRLCRESEATLRITCIQALGGLLRGRTHPEALAFLLRQVRGNDRSTFLAAVDALAAMKDPAIPGALLARYPGLDLARKRKVVDILGNYPMAWARTLPFLLELLRSEDSALRGNAAWALGKLGQTRAIPGLRRSIRDNQSNVMVNASAALARLGGRGHIPLLRTLARSGNAYVRANALVGLTRAKDGESRKLMKQLLDQDQNPWVRLNALRGLKVLGLAPQNRPPKEAPSSVEQFIRQVARDDLDLRVRAQAGQLLKAPAPSKPATTWIGLYLLQQDRRPLRDGPFMLITPRGLIKAALSDSLGEAWEEGLNPGRCHVEAPSYHQPNSS